MSTILSESRLSLSALARQEGVNVSTIWRWVQRGVRGVKLESFSIGARRYTTIEAFERFSELCTAAATGERRTVVSRRARDAENERAERELRELGL